MILIAAAAVMASVAWVIILLSPASDHPSPAPARDVASDAPLTTLAGHTSSVPAVAEAAGNSMVQLRATTSHGSVSLVGVAVAEGGLVITTADALGGLRSISMVGTGGRLLRASVVAIDNDSDLALVNVPGDIPVAPFADDASLTPSSADMTLRMATTGDGALALREAPGSVTSVGTPIAEGLAAGMPAITSSAPSVPEQSGDPLLNPAGAVIGILYNADPGSGPGTTTFLPTQLVLGVSDELRSTQRVAPGLLGIAGSDATGTVGAKVASIESGSPAAGRLHVGEVITAVDALPVRTMAELRARLYVLTPDALVHLSVLSGTVTHVVDVTLRGSP
jgi:S1-C subfamily serine protease